jgi:hypothetical protein
VTIDRPISGSPAFSHLVEGVTAAIVAGRIEGDPVQVSIYLWSVVHGLTSLLITKPEFPWPDRDALIDHVARSALRGVTVREAQYDEP